MVNWDRVEELRSKGWDWDRIADDPKVGFHPDTSVQEPGRALRGLYHRQRSRRQRQVESPTVTPRSTKAEREKAERKWTLPRIGYLLLPFFAVWFALAYVAPSPFGLVLKALPYLALCLVVVAFLLIFGLFRSTGPRWSKVFQSTVILGVVLGLVIVGLIGLTGYLFLHCPYLPATGTAQPAGWMSVSAAPWQNSGQPVLYFYGATWCPYCSASSWAIWKALSEFGSVSGTSTGYSTEDSIPYVNLASASVASSTIAFVVSEDTSGVQGTFPSTSNCIEQAYVTAYSNGIPFIVINGQYVHAGTLIQPTDVSSYSTTEMQQQVASENGSAWSIVQSQAWWMMAFLAKSAGATPSNLATQPYYSGWSTATKSAVASDLAQVS